MNFHEPLEIKSNFQQPSSSESPLTLFLIRNKSHLATCLGLKHPVKVDLLNSNTYSIHKTF